MSSTEKRPFNRVDDSHSLGQGWTLLLTDIVQITNHVSSSFIWRGSRGVLRDCLDYCLHKPGKTRRLVHPELEAVIEFEAKGLQLQIRVELLSISLPISCVREAIKLLGGKA